MSGFSTVICAICAAGDGGEEVSEETYLALTNTVRYSDGTIAPAPGSIKREDPMVKDDFMQERFLGYYRKVISTKVKEAVIAAKRAVPLSAQIAREKKRKRVFDIEDLEKMDGDK